MAENTRSYSLYKRGEVWYVRYHFTTPDGRRIRLRQSTERTDREAAERRAIELFRELSAATAKPDAITLSAAIARYSEEVISVRDKPLSYLRAEYGRFYRLTAFWPKDALLENITKAQVWDFITRCRKRGNSNATINRYLSALSALFNRARRFWDKTAPAFSPLSFRQKEAAENIKYLRDWDELTPIVDAAAPHLKPIVLTAVYTGLRLGNLLRLRWTDIDWREGNITVRVKGDKYHTVPIVAPLMTLLRDLKRDSRSPFVFTYNGEPILSIKKAWQSLFRRSGLPYVNFHALRHTAATWIYRATRDLRATKDIMGHADIATTLKYAHLVDGEKRRALEKTFGTAPHGEEPACRHCEEATPTKQSHPRSADDKAP